MKQYGFVMVSATELIVTIIAFIYIGQWIDKRYGLNQKAIIVSSVLGTVIGFVRFVMRLQEINKENE